ncbi:anthranilate synthase component I family protein [Marinilabiliaceae bacterium ANBcel2]|nr:anthranilate synthase component I family protein [Marinilabiliaceae bacterium ANBcel2]
MRKWIPLNISVNINIERNLSALATKEEYAVILTNRFKSESGFYKNFSTTKLLAGIGSVETVECKRENIATKISKDDWYMGFFSYDMIFDNKKRKKSSNEICFPPLLFFRPKWLIQEENGKLMLGYDKNITQQERELFILELTADQNKHTTTKKEENKLRNSKLLECEVTEKEYISTVNKIKKDIQRGDIYELNYCIEFSGKNRSIDPASCFENLQKISPMPFSAFIKCKQNYALSASPERYLTKKGDQIVSMPMKGTAARGDNKISDKKNRKKLEESLKERAENVMITDLVRNDLSQIAQKGSVKTEELCKSYKFPGVFQMVSTISAKLKENKNWYNAIEATFPMGSMTGAPKPNAIKLIDKYEKKDRALFSGAAGYITPNKDFDFNVMIRTLFYNQQNQKISYFAGSAITALSDAKEEYKECFLKAETVKKIL